MDQPKISLSEFDFHRLSKALLYDFSEELHQKLQKAEILSDIMIPPNLITLDSMVRYRDEEEGMIYESLLVLPPCPEDQNVVISVFEPIGAALLGLKTGDRFMWQQEGGWKTFSVLGLSYQPEAAGVVHPMTFHV